MIYKIKPALVIIDMQNGFMSSDGAFDKLGFDISNYQKIVPTVKESYRRAKALRLPVFLSQAIREKSGIDMLERQHNILPDKRRERIETLPLCIRDTWDSDFIDILQREDSDYVVQKRRDSIFQDTEFGLWLRSLKVDTIIFTGIDTSICVESSLRDAFNRGWDVILLSDATASLNDNFYQTTIIETKENFGLVMKSSELFDNLKKFGANLFLLNVKSEK
jgi:ureidoacrylate peracid hydrolase